MVGREKRATRVLKERGRVDIANTKNKTAMFAQSLDEGREITITAHHAESLVAIATQVHRIDAEFDISGIFARNWWLIMNGKQIVV